jgi:polar amino acid transport system substrate-binding protein
MKKKLGAVLLAGVLAIATLTGCSSSSSSDVQTTGATDTTEAADSSTSTSSGTFTVGFDQDFPPMGFVDEETGEYTGFDLALAAEVANRLGLEIKYQPIAWDAKDMELSSGTIDCIWNGFTMNGREDSYTWTDAYMENDQVFVVRKDSGITSSADLAGKIVDVQADSSAEAALKENEELANSFGQLITVADYNTAFMELESGAVDAIAMDNTVASYQIEKRNADFVVLDESIAAEEYGIGFKKGNTELRDKVQAALEEMAADGTMAKISTEWFGKDITIIGK